MTFLTVNKTSLIPHSAFHTEAATSRIFTSFFPATERKHGIIPQFPTKRNVSTMSLAHITPGIFHSPIESTISLTDWRTYLFYQWWQATRFFFFPLQHYRCMARRDTQFHSRAFKRVQISASTIRLVAQHLKITCKQSIALGQVPKHGSYQGKTNWQFRDSWINSR